MKKAITIIITLALFSAIQLTAFADVLPAPTWITVTENSDYTKTVSIVTPSYMEDAVDFYEYSTDGGSSWSRISDPAGGEFTITASSQVLIRYINDNVTSLSFSQTITVSTAVTVTSQSTGITLIIPKDSDAPQGISLAAYEIVSGVSYNAVAEVLGSGKSFCLYSVKLMLNNKEYDSTEELQWLFPTEGFEADSCKLYFYSEGAGLMEVPSQAYFNTLTATVTYTGIFAVVEDRAYSPGDVTGDGNVTAADARLALRASAKLQTLTELQQRAADLDSDGNVTSAEARRILRVAAGLESL